MICTSNYKDYNSDNYTTYSISGDRGKGANYQGKCYPKLAPKLAFWKIWFNNIGIISEIDNNKYYIEEYWNQVLSKLDPEEVYRELDNSILLCYESNEEFCHRHIVSAWFEITLGINVPEITVKDFDIKEMENPIYIKEYLEEIMRKSQDMKGFKSLRALYLYEKSEKLEAKANELEEKTGKCYDNYRQNASFLRADADMEEEKYRRLEKRKVR